jgi:DNA-binding response OmpR family regulator
MDGKFNGEIVDPSGAGTSPQLPAVLVVDDDHGTCDLFAAGLRRAGFDPIVAATAADAVIQARSVPIDAAVLDLRLPDMSGTELVAALRERGLRFPFVLTSAFLTTRAIVEAMRLGACEVMDKPIDIDDLCAAVRRMVERASAAWPVWIAPGRTPHSTAAERWAQVILRTCQADRDPKTLQDCAHLGGLSYTSLRELCRMLGIRAQDARDFARMLRALTLARRQRCAATVFLDVRDQRTLKLLLARAGLDSTASALDRSIDAFLAQQHFVDPRHPALQVLKVSLSETVTVQRAAATSS